MKIEILAEADGDGVKQAAGLKIHHLPANGMQTIKRSTLEQLNQFVTISQGKIIFHTEDGDVEFAIKYPPGRHCLTCGERLPDKMANGSEEEAKNAELCREHIATHGDDAVVTDRWPNGYITLDQSYLCEVVQSKLTKELTNG